VRTRLLVFACVTLAITFSLQFGRPNIGRVADFPRRSAPLSRQFDCEL